MKAQVSYFRSSKREQTEEFLLLASAWLVYGLCQRDLVLPLLAFVAVALFYVKQMLARFSRDVEHQDLSWRSLLGIGILLGGLWRNFVLPPDDAVAFIPIIVPAFQSASIILSVVVWFRLDYKYRSYALCFLPWLTVALSINVPFNGLSRLAFGLFCCLGVGVVVARLYFPLSQELRKVFQRSHYRDRRLYVFPVFLALVGSVVFVGLVRGVEIGDDFLMQYIRDYVGKGRWSLFEGPLSLSGSGGSMDHVRPIMEVERHGAQVLYLAGQVFEDYHDGVWQPAQRQNARELPPRSDTAKKRELILFDHLGGVVPAPRGVVAMASKGATYEQDQTGLVFGTHRNRVPKADVFTEESLFLEMIDRDRAARLTAMSPLLKEYLPGRVRRIVGEQTDGLRTARLIERYFKENYAYDLYVKFRADDRGLLYMLDRKPAAYCSFFASAMTLMLREQGIPARMVAGFLATEKAGRIQEKLLVRGRDAHAWVEALLPVRDRDGGEVLSDASGRPLSAWRAFDPTPADARWAALNQRRINPAADWLWRSQAHFKAALLDIETKTLVRVLFLVILFVAMEEIGKKVIARFFKGERGPGRSGPGWLTKTENRYEQIIKRLDAFVKKKFKIARVEAETDTEFLERLKRTEGVPSDIILEINELFACYQAARFGWRPEGGLEEMVEGLENKI